HLPSETGTARAFQCRRRPTGWASIYPAKVAPPARQCSRNSRTEIRKNENTSYNRNYIMNRSTQIAEPAEGGGQTLSSSIAGTLRAAISNCELIPGSKLRLDELRMMFGVSLSPLREALSRLSAEGFVVTEDQR